MFDRQIAVNAALVLSGVLLGVAAQLLLKAGTNAVGHFAFERQSLMITALKLAIEPHIIVALFLYVVSMAVWILVLSRIEVSVAYPMLSLGYAVNAVAAWLIFGEQLTVGRVVGIAVIMLGVLILARS